MNNRLAGVVVLVVASLPAYGEQSISWRNYVIHYTAFESTLIPEEVAAANGVVRSSNRLVTNIVIKQKNRNETVPAKVEGTVTNLLNQTSELTFREVNERDAVYYLASQVVDEQDTLRFNVKIRPTGEDEVYSLEFIRTWN
ncbi:MAG: DUF4426 domain-containing protein [Pseudomonadales bacterium]